MPPRIPTSMQQRFSSTVAQPRVSLPSNAFNINRAAAPLVAATATATLAVATATAPKLGRVARWYLPAMAAIAVGITLLPEELFNEPTKRTVTLDAANRRISYGIAHQLDQNNRRANQGYQPTQEELNQAMLNSYGDRSSLADMEKAIAGYQAGQSRPTGPHERNQILEEAYGDRSSLKHLRRAMEIYEVQ